MGLDDAYRWARGVRDSRIGLAGTTAGFAGYGFYGPDLSNHVTYLGEPGPHGAYNAIPTCEASAPRSTTPTSTTWSPRPFLNFLHSSKPVASPEARWLRGSGGVEPLFHEGQVTVWKVTGPLQPDLRPGERAAARNPGYARGLSLRLLCRVRARGCWRSRRPPRRR